MKLYTMGIAMGAVLGVLAQGASAASLTYDIGAPFIGKPSADGSKITATFVDNGTDSVTLTLQSFLKAGEFASAIYFNSTVAINNNDIVWNSGPKAVASYNPYANNDNSYKADGDGYFDLLFDFAKAGDDRFTTQTTVYTLTGTGLTPASFFVKSAETNASDSLPGEKSYYVAAHVQGLGLDGEGSTWLTDYNGSTPGAVVPLPSSLLLLGSALAGLSLVGRRKNS